MPRATGKFAAVVLLLVLAGCAAGADGSGATPGADTAGATGDALVITIDDGDGDGDGAGPVEHRFGCGATASGTLPDPAAVCAHLQELDDPFAPLPADQICTQQYDGPQTARITGRWNGRDVDLQLARTDGCQIARWNSLGPLLSAAG